MNIMNNSPRDTGILEPNITAPTSDRYTNWVTDTAATMKRVISFGMVAPITAGRNISAKPTTRV